MQKDAINRIPLHRLHKHSCLGNISPVKTNPLPPGINHPCILCTRRPRRCDTPPSFLPLSPTPFLRYIAGASLAGVYNPLTFKVEPAPEQNIRNILLSNQHTIVSHDANAFVDESDYTAHYGTPLPKDAAGHFRYARFAKYLSISPSPCWPDSGARSLCLKMFIMSCPNPDPL